MHKQVHLKIYLQLVKVIFDGPAVDAKSIIDLDVIQSGIVLPTDPKMQEAFIAKQMEANPTLSREQVIEEIQKAIRSGRLK